MVHARWFPHVKVSEPSNVGGMAVGQYLAGLGGFVRKEEHLDEMALVAELNLAIGQHNDVHIVTTPLSTMFGPSQWETNTELLTSPMTVIPFHFVNHWEIAIAVEDSGLGLRPHGPRQCPELSLAATDLGAGPRDSTC